MQAKRRMNMSVLKAPPKQPRNATLQIRVDEELKLKLDKYAEFLDSTTAYVVSEALKLVFNKDAEFKEWLESQSTNSESPVSLEASLTAESAKELSVAVVRPPKVNGNGLFR
jgi:predicted transcriptional regulator